MPTVVRSRPIDAPVESVWSVVSDAYHLPRWWPRVDRVEDVSEDGWTTVTRSSRGRAVRADFTRVHDEPGSKVVWRQEVRQTPFERFLRESVTGVVLTGEGNGTRVELRLVRKLRGMARLGGVQMRRAMGRELDEALDALEHAVVT